ncbi:MAG TPA: hypothetical protein VJU61_07365 [Polyangiaceae bacterium]|nr:hypothetical protein [Polyangiaceae bacterium]
MTRWMTNESVTGAVVGAMVMLTSSIAGAEAFERRAIEQVYLGRDGGVRTPLLQLEVSAGTWLITAKATIDNAGAADYFSCGLLPEGLDGNPSDSSATMVGSAGGMPGVATLYNQRILTFVAPTTVALVCWHDSFLEPIIQDPLAPPLLGPSAQKGASLIVSRVGDAPPGPSCELENGCLPGHLRREQAELDEESDEEGRLPDGASPLEEGYLCEAPPVTLAEACLSQPSLQVRNTWLYDDEQGPLRNTCPKRARYMWCTDFGYCWCSSNPG